jgi:hypothetical protein
VDPEVSAKDVVARSCAQALSYFKRSYYEMTSVDVNRLQELSGPILARKEEIVRDIVEALLRDPDASKLIQEHDPTGEDLRRALGKMIDLLLLGSYDAGHCFELAKESLLFVRIGFPLVFVLSRLAVIIAREVLRRAPSRGSGAIVGKGLLIRALHWNLIVLIISYESVMRRVYEKFLFGRVLGVNEKTYKRLEEIVLKEFFKELSGEAE